MSPTPLREDRRSVVQEGVCAGSRRHDGAHDACGSAPAFGHGEGGCDANPGATEGSRSSKSTPSQGKLGHLNRDTTANEHDPTDGTTEFRERVQEGA
jgi:hypothetical protein